MSIPSLAIATILSTLTTAADGVLFLSEDQAPFTPVWAPLPDGRAGSPIGEPVAGRAPEGPVAGVAGSMPALEAAVRMAFDIPDAEPVVRRPAAAVFRYGIEDADPNDPQTAATRPRVQALRDALLAAVPEAEAFRVGRGPWVRYLVVGPVAAAPGASPTLGAPLALVGLATQALET